MLLFNNMPLPYARPLANLSLPPNGERYPVQEPRI